MLATQVQYWQYKEGQRHNLVAENQTQQSINESIRHNLQTEQIGWGNLAETTRHNKVSESIGWGNLSELTRHNQATEQIGRQQALAAWNSSIAARTSANAASRNAYTNAVNAITRQKELDNTIERTKAEVTRWNAQTAQGWVNTAISGFGTYAKSVTDTLKGIGSIIPF